jgi:hypothetical protein
LDGGFLLLGYRQFKYRREASNKLENPKVAMTNMLWLLMLDESFSLV